jgi:hypothetical protein
MWQQALQRWISKPFDPEGDALTWILWLGLIVLGIGFWQFVLLEFEEKI